MRVVSTPSVYAYLVHDHEHVPQIVPQVVVLEHVRLKAAGLLLEFAALYAADEAEAVAVGAHVGLV